MPELSAVSSKRVCDLPRADAFEPPPFRESLSSHAARSVRSEMEGAPVTALDSQLRKLHFG